MEQRALGRTGLRVSALGFGCGDVGGLTHFCVVLLNPLVITATAGVLFFAARRRWGAGVALALVGAGLHRFTVRPPSSTRCRRR